MTNCNVGDKVVWKGKKYTVLSHYNQPTVRIVDEQGRGQSVPLSRLIADMMNNLKDQL